MPASRCKLSMLVGFMVRQQLCRAGFSFFACVAHITCILQLAAKSKFVDDDVFCVYLLFGVTNVRFL